MRSLELGKETRGVVGSVGHHGNARSLLLLRARLNGQRDTKCRAGPFPRTRRGDGASVQLDQMSYDRQAEPQPHPTRPRRPLQKVIEDPRQDIRGNALAGI